jgi:predicted metalloprotease with PDZ domain
MIPGTQCTRWVVVFVALLFARPAHATIDYTVSIAHPERHIVTVTMRVPNARNPLTVQMPAWDALYQIRDFSSHVMQMTARDDENHALPLVKLDKQTWQVTATGMVTITYPIYWDEAGPFASQLNADHAFLNLAMILLYVPDRRAEDTRLKFDGVPEPWRVAVELNASGTSPGGKPGGYEAASYDALVDAPVEIGVFDEFHISAGNRSIRVVVHGDAGDRARLSDTLKRIVDYQVSLMGEAPFLQYMFLIHVGQNFGGGGMEHSNSTAIAADIPAQLPNYAAHELFHAWNVKRIRPQSLEPVDYTKEMWTRSLWFAEGVTNTYASYTLVRTGLWTTQQFYADIASQINELEMRPAHRWQSVEQSSLDAWYEKYPLYTRPEESISYYNKGQLVGLILDITMRDRSDNRAGLDDMLRALNVDFAQRGRFYDDSEGLRAVAEQVIRKKAPDVNPDLKDFFAHYVSGTAEIPFSSILERAGLAIRDTAQHRASLGFAISRDSGGAFTVGSLNMESGAGQAGLLEGDTLLHLNGEAIPRSPDRWLRDHQPGERVTVRIRRSGEEREFSFPLSRITDGTYQITEMPEATEIQRRIRNGILHGTTDPTR